MIFELPKQQVKLVKASTPVENHGNDYKLACVLSIEATINNQQLKAFAPALCDSLYRMPAEGESTDLAADQDSPSVLRFPKMSPFSWDHTLVGYTVTVDYGLGDKSNMVLNDAKIDKFTITPMEGGSVVIGFNIAVHPSDLEVGRLCAKQKQNIEITIAPPPAQNVKELFVEGDSKSKKAA